MHRTESRGLGEQQAGDCPHRPPCGGCPRFGEPGIASAARDALEALARAHGLASPRVVSGATAGFRHRARLAIRGREGAPKIGLFQPGTHRVVPVPQCSVQHPLVNRVAAVVRRALVDANVSCYSEATHRGVARYLQVVVERQSQCAQVVLVANAETTEPLAGCLERVVTLLGNDLHSLWLNVNTARTNTILGREFHKWCGPDTVVESFGGAAVHFPPGAFGQSNLDIAERIIEQLREETPQGSRVTEFYAGVGAIGLSILPRADALCMNEVSPASLDGMALGIAGLAADERRKVSVVAGTADSACEVARDADVVIVDPPRKGLDAALLEVLRSHPPGRLLYVSCGLSSLLRDAAQLSERGALKLVSLTAYDLLPYTEHVETVACFERRS